MKFSDLYANERGENAWTANGVYIFLICIATIGGLFLTIIGCLCCYEGNTDEERRKNRKEQCCADLGSCCCEMAENDCCSLFCDLCCDNGCDCDCDD